MEEIPWLTTEWVLPQFSGEKESAETKKNLLELIL